MGTYIVRAETMRQNKMEKRKSTVNNTEIISVLIGGVPGSVIE